MVRPSDEESFLFFHLAALQGHADAQLKVAISYEEGIGARVDPVEACRFYKMSADQGNSQSQFTYAINLKNGNGVPLDLNEACRYASLAAEQGHSRAKGWLGQLYDRFPHLKPTSGNPFFPPDASDVSNQCKLQ